MPQDDAPPAGVVGAVVQALPSYFNAAWDEPAELATAILDALRTLPAADRQALAEWIAPEGWVLVPSDAFREAMALLLEARDFAARTKDEFAAMLAAAKDSG